MRARPTRPAEHGGLPFPNASSIYFRPSIDRRGKHASSLPVPLAAMQGAALPRPERSARAASRLAWRAGLIALVGLAVIAWVLYPVFFHGFVRQGLPSAQQVEALRSEPAAATLRELATMTPLGNEPPPGLGSVAWAERWLREAADPASANRQPVSLEVTYADVQQGRGIGLLPYSSLYGAEVMLAAYRVSGDDRFLLQARDLILAYARYERTAWRDPGFLWNDHAIAARIGVVIRFWNVYREHRAFAPDAAAEILQHVARSAVLLARPSHFTAWSNHGVMQNLALMQLAIAFPGLVDSKALLDLAFERLSMQWPFYVSDEGVVLEHSAGYQEMGVLVLRLGVRLLEMAQRPVPASWREWGAKSADFLQRIRRPDGSLPAYGDTFLARHTLRSGGPVQVERDSLGPLALFPLSGYAVWQNFAADGAVAAHSVVGWSHFPGHAHQHADVTSLSLWARGRSWVTASGYAPYGTEYREPIVGWQGSNAPHLVAESPRAVGESRLLGSAASPGALLLDTERTGAGALRVRRQVVALAGGRWLVLDHVQGAGEQSRVETIWTFMPDLVVARQAAERYELSDREGPPMRASFFPAAAGAERARLLSGSREPFAGWIADEHGAHPAPALRVESTGPGWSATLFELAPVAAGAEVQFTDPEHWLARGAGWEVRRSGAAVQAQVDGRSAQSAVVPPPDTRPAREAIQASLARAVAAYPKYRELDEYRLRVARLLGGAWLLQAAALAAAVRLRWRWAGSGPVLGALALAWVALGAWLGVVYFAD